MISVIIPAYNVENYIEECILSLINQSYRNIDIIIIDDGSTDNTREVIRKYERTCSNITCYEQRNQGVSVARNFGLQKANGEFVIFIDPDDYLEDNMLLKMYKKMTENSVDIVICGHNVFYEDFSGNYIKNIYNIDKNKIYSNTDILNMMLELKVKGYVWDKLFRKDMLLENNFKFEEGRYVQDWFPVIKQVFFSKKIAFVNEALYYYRQRNSSTIYKKNKKLIDDYAHTVKEIDKFLNESIIEVNLKSKKVFYAETYYTIMRHYYLYYSKTLKYSEIYIIFNESDDIKGFNFKLSYLLDNKVNMKLKLKILLWKLRVFHIFFK